MLRGAVKRGELAHQAGHKRHAGFLPQVGQALQNGKAVITVAGQGKVAHNHAFLQVAVGIVHWGTGLQQHLADGGVRHLWVILRGGKLFRQGRAGIFVIRQPDVHIPGQSLYGFHGFVPAGVIGHRQGQPIAAGGIQRLRHPRQPLRCGDKVQVFGAFLLQFHKNFSQALRRQRLAKALLADLVILAVAALQGAAGKKYRAAAGRGVGVSAQAGLLPMVQGGAGGQQGIPRAAIAGAARRAVGPAAPRA